MDLRHMGCHAVEGLECTTCKISSCCHPYMKTPVSYYDAHKKKLKEKYLKEDKKKGMFFLDRFHDGYCIYFDRKFSCCSLEAERRPTSCLVFPVRLKEINVGMVSEKRVILNMKCPSAIPMAEALIAGDKSVIQYIKTAVKLFEEDTSYAQFVLNNTKDFVVTLDLGSFGEWRSE